MPWFGLAGVVVTFFFIPDTTGLDLREQERYWTYVRQGRAEEYHGVAVHPQHLSVYERWVLKRHLAYDPEKDREDRVDALRVVYESWLIAKKNEAAGDEVDPHHELEFRWLSNDIIRFFELEGGEKGRVDEQTRKERALTSRQAEVRPDLLATLQAVS